MAGNKDLNSFQFIFVFILLVSFFFLIYGVKVLQLNDLYIFFLFYLRFCPEEIRQLFELLLPVCV